MIPYELAFSGIRDFKDTRLAFGEAMEHVLIAGANGSGKSTITFCMGAVLASPKVDLEGLRSRNLPADQVWRAEIQFLFQTGSGAPAKGQPAFVCFQLQLEQHPGEPLRKEFWILEGEQPGVWEQQACYTAADGMNSLKAYRDELQHTYKVDPDAYYLIWYQQDVNQFAVMRPEERFRIFSEMNGIESLQRSWEQVKEQRKEAAAELQTAESNQHLHQLHLGNWEQERDRLLSRNERRKEGLHGVLLASETLSRFCGSSNEQLCSQLADLEGRQQRAAAAWEALEQQCRQDQAACDIQRQRKQGLEQTLDSVEKRAVELRKHWHSLNEQHRQLADQLGELGEQAQGIPYSEADVRSRLEQNLQAFEAGGVKRQEAAQSAETAQAQLDQLASKLGELRYAIADDNRKLEEADRILNQYGASSALERELSQLEHQRGELRDQERELTRVIQALQEQVQALTSKEVRSRRQEKSIRHLQAAGYTVYTMRDLLELDEQTALEREDRLEAIKYTLFVNGRGFVPATDLYHVELPAIIPARALGELRALGLRIRSGLDDQAYAAAQKALWWVREMHAESHEGTFLDGATLVDSLGRRGAQEEKQWLLNARGAAMRLRRMEEELGKRTAQRQEVERQYSVCEDRWHFVRSVLHRVQDAAQVHSAVAERDLRLRDEQRERAEQMRWIEIREQAQVDAAQLDRKLAECQLRIESLSAYAEVYDRLQQESAGIHQLQQTAQLLEQARKELQHAERELEDAAAEATALDRSLEKARRRLAEKQQEADETGKELQQVQEAKREAAERQEVAEANLAAEQQFYQYWRQTLPAIIEDIQRAEPDFPVPQHWNETQARNYKEAALVQLNQACRETPDENAVENYTKVRQQFERGEQEVQAARSLLTQLNERLIAEEEKLAAKINHEVGHVHTKFAQYMAHFGFDGEVSWQMHELKQGNVKYFLHIKARKQGHRGVMEEISARGRGGRVGKGVSGGEESLSSLLYALALLKMIPAKSSYIILDEFDSALDESRKAKVFQLYASELARKMVIVSPKSHESDYAQQFGAAFVVYHDARLPQSAVIRLKRNVLANQR
ncbi:chromosome segregation protein SMC [Paenibacillaceae bacterium]|nr:chromosome segregation protein SMC [Paenibacillaceae bacterium]